MLKDRRALLEQEIKEAHIEAADMYLNIVTNDGDVHSADYQAIRDKISNLQFDLTVVNQLIHKGHP